VDVNRFEALRSAGLDVRLVGRPGEEDVKLKLRGSARAFERRMVVGIQIGTYAAVCMDRKLLKSCIFCCYAVDSNLSTDVHQRPHTTRHAIGMFTMHTILIPSLENHIIS
jgi:hypothetical protein